MLTPIIRDIFRAYNVVDRPGFRKVHSYPIPRVGGASIAVAFFFGLNSLRGTGSVFPTHWLQKILSGAAVILIVGLLDDFFDLRASLKLLGQIAASIVAFANGIGITRIGTHDLPVWVGLPVTVLWLLLTMNAMNLIDGLDGLSGGMGFWAALTFFAGGLVTGNTVLSYTALPLAGALLGFLFFNFNPATVFMGDSGALFVGFMAGSLGLVFTQSSLTWSGVAFTALALCVPLLDVTLSIARRFLRNRPIFSADRGHMHHRLLDLGLSVREAAGALYAADFAAGAIGVLLILLIVRLPGHEASILPVTVAAALGLSVAGVSKLRYAEFEVATRALFGRDFKAGFAQKIRLERLATSLELAGNIDEWWNLLAAAGQEEHWVRLRWIDGSRVIREQILAKRRPEWSFTIELEDAQSIQVEGDGETGEGPLDLIGLCGIVNRSMVSHRRARQESA